MKLHLVHLKAGYYNNLIKLNKNSPDVVAVGPKTGAMNPVISLTIQQTNQRTLDDLISEKIEIKRSYRIRKS